MGINQRLGKAVQSKRARLILSAFRPYKAFRWPPFWILLFARFYDLFCFVSFQSIKDHGEVEAFVLVYSITDRESFEHVIERLGEIRRDVGSNVAVIVVANKSDLVRTRQVSDEGKVAFILLNYLVKFCKPYFPIKHLWHYMHKYYFVIHCHWFCSGCFVLTLWMYIIRISFGLISMWVISHETERLYEKDN